VQKGKGEACVFFSFSELSKLSNLEKEERGGSFLILIALSRARKKKEAVGPDAFYLKERRSAGNIGRIRRMGGS
jgi:hypothetical protein